MDNNQQYKLNSEEFETILRNLKYNSTSEGNDSLSLRDYTLKNDNWFIVKKNFNNKLIMNQQNTLLENLITSYSENKNDETWEFQYSSSSLKTIKIKMAQTEIEPFKEALTGLNEKLINETNKLANMANFEFLQQFVTSYKSTDDAWEFQPSSSIAISVGKVGTDPFVEILRELGYRYTEDFYRKNKNWIHIPKTIRNIRLIVQLNEKGGNNFDYLKSIATSFNDRDNEWEFQSNSW
jgi:hypothetical protein